MNSFEFIKTELVFLTKEYDFEIIGEETSPISDYDLQCNIVKYINEFVLIEIGSCEDLCSGGHIELEIRRLENGIPVNYKDEIGAINLNVLIELTNIDNKQYYISNFNELANILKQHIDCLTTPNWFQTEAVKKAKEGKQDWNDETLQIVEIKNKDFLNANGFYFLKSNNTISSFECSIDRFFTYSNGTHELTLKYDCDVREQYYCYNIYYTGKKNKGVFPSKDCINNISRIIKDFVSA